MPGRGALGEIPLAAPADEFSDSIRASRGMAIPNFGFFGTLERETGFEPATNSLEGCDSTPELLPLALASVAVLVEAGGFEPP